MKTQIKQFDLYGKRNHKYDFLLKNNLKSINWNKLNPTEPNYFFVNKNFYLESAYNNCFKIDEIFLNKVSGVETVRDSITIHFTIDDLKDVLYDFNNLHEIDISLKYKTKDARDWKINRAKEDIILNINQKDYIRKISYRYFDDRYTFYTGKQNGFVCNGRFNIMKHMLKENLAIILPRLCKGQNGFNHGFISQNIIDRAFGDAFSGAGTNVFPLYLYPDQGEQGELIEQTRTPNLNLEIVREIEKVLGLEFRSEKNATPSFGHPSKGGELEEDSLKNNPLTNNYQTKNSPPDGGVAASADGVVQNTFAPIDLLDYIYAVLHSPAYREKYKEFLKIDFPRVPYPNIKTFWQLVEIGKQIREIHLLESPIVEDYITKYPIDGSNIVEKVSYKDGNVFINSEQYFEGVPEVAWNFYIGGYQPAQKWLKDRKDRELNFDDIMHYQKIIVALTETDKLMNEIDNIGVE